MNQVYLDTARLLTQVAPFVFVDDPRARAPGSAESIRRNARLPTTA